MSGEERDNSRFFVAACLLVLLPFAAAQKGTCSDGGDGGGAIIVNRAGRGNVGWWWWRWRGLSEFGRKIAGIKAIVFQELAIEPLEPERVALAHKLAEGTVDEPDTGTPIEWGPVLGEVDLVQINPQCVQMGVRRAQVPKYHSHHDAGVVDPIGGLHLGAGDRQPRPV